MLDDVQFMQDEFCHMQHAVMASDLGSVGLTKHDASIALTSEESWLMLGDSYVQYTWMSWKNQAMVGFPDAFPVFSKSPKHSLLGDLFVMLFCSFLS